MIELRRVESFDDWESIWNSFVEEHSNELTIGSNPCLRKFFLSYFNYNDYYHFVIQNDRVVGILPAVLVGSTVVSLPHLSYSGIIIDEGINGGEEAILNKVSGIVKNYDIRGLDLIGDFCSYLKVTSWLNLKASGELQMQAFRSKLRSQIRKGFKNGLIVESGGIEFIDDFYHVYARNMYQLGSPVLPKSFFEGLIEACKKSDVRIFLVRYDNNTIGGGFVLSYKQVSEVCWASTLREHNGLSTNMVLYWAMIEYSANNKKEVFSFGRSSKDSNTLRFKRQWGAEERQLYFNSNKERKIDIKKAHVLTKLWKILPYRLTTLLGPPIAKRIY